MSDIENRKVQDILREVAADDCKDVCYMVKKMRDSLSLTSKLTYAEELTDCLNEIANRIDKQSVVKVQVPMSSDPFTRIAELYPMTRGEAMSAIEHWLAGRNVAPKPEPDSDQLVPGELEAMTPAIIDVHDCIIEIRIEGSDD